MALSTSNLNAQTLRDTAEEATDAISAAANLQAITDILRASFETGNSERLNATCIVAMDVSVKTNTSPVGKIRRIFGGVSDPAFEACVAEFCALGEGHTSFAKWVYAEQCLPD